MNFVLFFFIGWNRWDLFSFSFPKNLNILFILFWLISMNFELIFIFFLHVLQLIFPKLMMNLVCLYFLAHEFFFVFFIELIFFAQVYFNLILLDSFIIFNDSKMSLNSLYSLYLRWQFAHLLYNYLKNYLHIFFYIIFPRMQYHSSSILWWRFIIA